MTTPRIPSGLKPLVGSYSGTGTPGAEATEVEGGMPRYGLAYDRGVQTFNVALSLTASRYSAWNTFYHRVINKGSLTFVMEIDAGYGCQERNVNMVPGSYNVARAGLDTIVTFQIQTENPAYDLTDDEVAAIILLDELYGDDVDTFFDRLAKFANVDSLVLDF